VYDDNEDDDMKLSYYLEIGAISLEGVDENGEMIFSVSENAKDLAPELWEAHVEYVDSAMMDLYEKGLMEVEYDENLEATIKLSPEGHRVAKELGLIEMDRKDIPND
jgi:hypothetical protein